METVLHFRNLIRQWAPRVLGKPCKIAQRIKFYCIAGE